MGGGFIATPRPVYLGKETRFQLYRELHGLQVWSGWVRIISAPQEFDPRTVQPIACRCTDYNIPAHRAVKTSSNMQAMN